MTCACWQHRQEATWRSLREHTSRQLSEMAGQLSASNVGANLIMLDLPPKSARKRVHPFTLEVKPGPLMWHGADADLLDIPAFLRRKS